MKGSRQKDLLVAGSGTSRTSRLTVWGVLALTALVALSCAASESVEYFSWSGSQASYTSNSEGVEDGGGWGHFLYAKSIRITGYDYYYETCNDDWWIFEGSCGRVVKQEQNPGDARIRITGFGYGDIPRAATITKMWAGVFHSYVPGMNETEYWKHEYMTHPVPSITVYIGSRNVASWQEGSGDMPRSETGPAAAGWCNGEPQEIRWFGWTPSEGYGFHQFTGADLQQGVVMNLYYNERAKHGDVYIHEARVTLFYTCPPPKLPDLVCLPTSGGGYLAIDGPVDPDIRTFRVQLYRDDTPDTESDAMTPVGAPEEFDALDGTVRRDFLGTVTEFVPGWRGGIFEVPMDGVYYLEVTALNVDGLSTSKHISATWIPRNVQATDGAFFDHIEITWDEVPAASAYVVARADIENGEPSWTRIVDPSDLSCIDADCDPNRPYWYTVRAVIDPHSLNNGLYYYSGGSGPYSAADAGIRIHLPAPLNVQASDSTSLANIRITWDEVPGATAYEVARADIENGEPSWTYVVDSPNLSCIDTDCSPGRPYWYTVRAVIDPYPLADGSYLAGHNSPYSAADAGMRKELEAPRLTSVRNGSNAGTVVVSWSKVTDAHGYEIRRADGVCLIENSHGSKIGETNRSREWYCPPIFPSCWEHAPTRYIDGTVSPGKRYSYFVRAYHSVGGDRMYYSEFSACVAGYAAPQGPTQVSASDGTAFEWVDITWTEVDGATGYKVWRSESENGEYVEDFDGDEEWDDGIIDAEGSLVWRDTFAEYGTTYWYRIQARCDDVVSPLSQASSGHRRELESPGNVQASDGTAYAHVEITWKPVEGANRYTVVRTDSEGGVRQFSVGTHYLSPDAGDEGDDASTDADRLLVWRDTTAEYGKTYWYKIKARRGTGEPSIHGPLSGTDIGSMAPPPIATSPTHDEGSASEETEIRVDVALPESPVVTDGFAAAWTQDEAWSLSGANQGADWTGETFTATKDGDWWFYLAAVDVAGTWSETTHLGPYIIDTTAPTVAVTAPADEVGAAPIAFSAVFSEPVTGLEAADIVVINGQITSLQGTGSSYTIRVEPETYGLVSVQIPATAAQDAVGHGNLASSPAEADYIDIVSPSVSIGSEEEVTSVSPILFVASFGEPVTDLSGPDIEVTNGSVVSVDRTSESSFDITVDPHAQGDVIVQISAGMVQDEAGNGNEPSDKESVEYDRMPELSEVTITTDNASGEYCEVGDTVTLALTASEELRGLPEVEIGRCDADVTYQGGNEYTATCVMDSSTREGEIEFEIVFEDGVGAEGTADETTDGSYVIFDSEPPVIEDCPGDITVPSNQQPEVEVYWDEPTAEDYLSDVASFTSTHSPGDKFPAQSTTTVTYTATDHAGNVSTCSFEVEVQ